MVSLETPVCDFGAAALDFKLPDPMGKVWTLEQCCGENGLLVMFICNHCPYVKAIIERLVRDTTDLEKVGIKSVAIMSNDKKQYKEDSAENMKLLAEKYGFNFPYLIDASQEVAKSYGAVCTPDFFGYNKNLTLQYRGRLDASRKETATPNVKRELYDAMLQVAQTNHGPKEQIPSMGCSIKWLEE